MPELLNGKLCRKLTAEPRQEPTAPLTRRLTAAGRRLERGMEPRTRSVLLRVIARWTGLGPRILKLRRRLLRQVSAKPLPKLPPPGGSERWLQTAKSPNALALPHLTGLQTT